MQSRLWLERKLTGHLCGSTCLRLSFVSVDPVGRWCVVSDQQNRRRHEIRHTFKNKRLVQLRRETLYKPVELLVPWATVPWFAGFPLRGATDRRTFNKRVNLRGPKITVTALCTNIWQSYSIIWRISAVMKFNNLNIYLTGTPGH